MEVHVAAVAWASAAVGVAASGSDFRLLVSSRHGSCCGFWSGLQLGVTALICILSSLMSLSTSSLDHSAPRLLDRLQGDVEKKEKWIGSGSFGQVYLASNRLCGLFCAIKEIHLDPDSKEQSGKLYWGRSQAPHPPMSAPLFIAEINLLSQFSHPNIVQYYGSNLTNGILSIYMKYMPEGSIHKLLKDGPFNENRIRHCTAQILSGLAYLHGMEIAHRDIKGGNILVGPNGEVKLADFGLAKKISYEAATHSDKGTSFWMAPEVIKSKSSGNGYNLLADIWSLGCTVIEMATGRHPWHEHCRTGESCNHPAAGYFRVGYTDDTSEIPECLSEPQRKGKIS